MTLSIIVPVYKTEDTLDRCLQSLTGQSFTNLDIILVDDQSPDACPRKCDEWAEKDNRIRVIHQANKGLSEARNAGIAIARGDFITFVDSDDFLDPHTYEEVMPLTDDADIVEFPVFRFYGSPHQSLLSFKQQCYTDMGKYWLEARVYEHTYAWNKIYRRQLFDGVSFPPGRLYEDIATLPTLIKKSTRIITTDKGVYYYCYNPNGITATPQGSLLELLLEGHLAVMECWCDDTCYMKALNVQLDVCRLTGHAPKLPHRFVSVFAKGLTAKERLKAVILDLFGIKGICKINTFIRTKS